MSENIKKWNNFIATKTTAEKKLIEEGIALNTKAKFDLWHNYCAVCLKELTEEEVKAIKTTAYNYTCKDHEKYADCYQLEKALKTDGLPVKDLNTLMLK